MTIQLTAQNVFLDENTGGKGKYFKARFLQPGLVKYSFGVCLLDKETIDKFINQFVGCPVIIGHKDVTNENAKILSCGNICHIWYDQTDGWYWGDGIIDKEEAISLINQGYNVSCQYEITEYSNNTTGALHNGNTYDKVILNGKPEHLAIVDRPRYENAFIAVNALDLTAENENKWVTIKPNGDKGKGRHLLIKDGENVYDAMRRQWGIETKGQLHLFDKKKYNSDKKYKDELYAKLQEHQKNVQKRYDNLEYLGVADPDELEDGDYEDITFEEWEDKQKEDSFLDDATQKWLNTQPVEKRKAIIKALKSKKEAEEFGEKQRQIIRQKQQEEKRATEQKRQAEQLKKYSEAKEKNAELVKTETLEEYLNRKGVKARKGSIYELHKYDWEQAQESKESAKNTIRQAINELKGNDMFKKLFNRKEKHMDKDEMKSLFIECLQECLQAKNEADEKDKEDDKKDELEKEKEAANSRSVSAPANACKNESVDKRDIIRQIMAIAGKEEASEDVKTIAKLAEKLAYDKSEAGTADNEAEDEDEKDKKEEEAKNKAKNSIEEIKSLFSNIGVKKPASTYVTQKDAIELGNELF